MINKTNKVNNPNKTKKADVGRHRQSRQGDLVARVHKADNWITTE